MFQQACFCSLQINHKTEKGGRVKATINASACQVLSGDTKIKFYSSSAVGGLLFFISTNSSYQMYAGYMVGLS